MNYLTYIQNTIQEGYSNTERINDRLNQTLSTITDVSDRLYVDTELQDMVLTNYKNSWEVVDAYNNHPIFEDYLDYYKEIANIRFYEQNSNCINTNEFRIYFHIINHFRNFFSIIHNRPLHKDILKRTPNDILNHS